MLLSGTRGKVSSSTVGEPRDVALALDAIGRLSRGEVAAITLAGGAICGWLAAFAHVFLDLEIELQDSDKNLVMKTVADNKRVHIIVLFGQVKSHDVQVSSTSYYISSGTTFLKPYYLLQTGRVPWDKAIQRTFGSLGTELLEAKRPFGTLIGCAARIFAAVAHNDKGLIHFQSRIFPKEMGLLSNPSPKFFRNWIGYNTESFGRGYVNFAIERLHELNDLRDTIEPCLGYPVEKALADYEAASLKLMDVCSCKGCDRKVLKRAPKRSNCIYRLGEFIIILLWQLSLIDMNTKIQPSQRGLETLFDAWDSSDFHENFGDHESIEPLLSYLNSLTIHQAAMYLFAGCGYGGLIHLPTSRGMDHTKLIFTARAKQGLCFFVDTLVEISDRPETRKVLHILPGTIEGPSGSHFDVIEDGNQMNRYQEGELKPLQDYKSLEKSDNIPLESKLLVQESLQKISASIQISGPKGNIYIGPMILQRDILWGVGLIDCPGRDCDSITEQGLSRMMVVDDGIMPPESSPEGRVILRKLAGNSLARCISVAMPLRDIDNYGKRLHYDKDAAVLLRRDECIPCCIRAGLSNKKGCTFITL